MTDESIYNLVPILETSNSLNLHDDDDHDAAGESSHGQRKIKGKYFKTKFYPQVHEEFKKRKKATHMQHRTIGMEKVEAPQTSQFSKKCDLRPRFLPDISTEKQYRHQVKNILEKCQSASHERYEKSKPEEKNLENFVARNVVDNICKKVTPPKRNVVDHYKGDKYCLNPPKTNPGLEKKFVFKQGYGEVPPYVARRLRGLQRTMEGMKKFYEQKACLHENRLVKSNERQDIIDGLKRAWHMANKQYLCLSLSSDTLRHLKEKIGLEKELKELENDIKFMEKYKHIIIKAE